MTPPVTERRAFARRRTALALMVALSLAACGSDDDDDDGAPASDEAGGPAPDADGLVTLDIDATAGGFGTEPDDPADRWAYLDLDTGRTLDIDDAAADASTEWDIAFKRVDVRLNGGASGPGEAVGGIVDAQLELYDEEGEPDVDAFLEATAEGEREAIARAVDPVSIEYVDDAPVAAILGDGVDTGASWWIYDPANRAISANPSVRYAVRGADGESYAKARVTDIQQAERQVTVELELQPAGGDAFDVPATWVATIGPEGGASCYYFATMGEVDCEANAATWDLQAEITPDGRAWHLWTNGGTRGEGGSGASFGPLDAATAASFATGDDVPVWTEDSAGGVFEEYPWYAYSLRDENRIWPNFRVYAIDTGESAFKLQVLRYYDEAGTSGMIRVRFAPLDGAGAGGEAGAGS